MVANFTGSTQKLTNSSKSNPCPVCGRTKDGDCRISHDGGMVLCHNNFDHAKTQQPDVWHFDGSSSDNRCGIYIFKDKTASETDKSYRGQVSGRRPTKRISKPKPAPIPAGSRLLRLPAPQHGPEPQKPQYIPEGVPASAVLITYNYSDTQQVYRFEWPDPNEPKGHDKTYRQSHINGDGEVKWNKGNSPWPAYRVDEVVETLKGVPDDEPVVVLMLEGERNVELGRFHSIAGLTLQGSNWNDSETAGMVEALRATGKNIVLAKLRDNDSTGVKKGSQIKSVCDRLQFPCIIVDPVAIYPDIPEKGDIKEILDNMDADEFIRRLEAQIHASAGVADADWDDSIGEKEDEETGERPDKKPPSPQKTAAKIAEEYGHQWKFDNEQKAWRIWTGKEWEKIEIGNFETLLMTVIDAKNIPYRGDSYLTDVLRLLTKKLRVAKWQMWDRKRYISFSNYVLDASKGKSLEHSPGMGFTSHLPFEYKPLKRKVADTLKTLQENCPITYRWMNTAMKGDRRKIFKLLAIINGLLKFRFFDLQMFVHLVGKPGSGKGTFIRLLQKIVGRENWKGCKLKHLEDGSTMASIIDKQLVACPDERAATGVDAILSLTGGDAISYREVYRPAADAFFYGLLIVGSNNPIFVGDTTGLDRRLCLVHFDNPLPTVLRNSQIENEMDAEISQLIAVTLDIPDSEVAANIQGVGKNQIAEFKFQEWDMKLQTNSVAAHFDDWLIVDPTASIPSGKLYEHYKNWCDTGLKAVSHIKYPKMLSELCNDYLELTGIKWQRSGGRSWFEGLRLRTEGETLPTHSDSLSALIPTDTGFDGVCTGFVRGSESLPDGNYSDLRGLGGENILKNLPLDAEPENKALNKVQEVGEKLEKVKLNPVNPVEAPKPLLLADLNPVANPVATPSEPHQTPSLQPSPIAPDPELETAPTAQAVQLIAPLIEKVTAAQTWAEVATVWADDLELKAQIKAQLSKAELIRIGKLYRQAHPSPPIVEAEPIALTNNSPAQESAEPEPAPELTPEQTPEQTPEPAQITPEDAEKMRDIALIWWPEYYPEQLQTLITQMFGWGAPAKKYSAVQIARWLQGEDDLVRDRIGELMAIGLANNCEADAEE